VRRLELEKAEPFTFFPEEKRRKKFGQMVLEKGESWRVLS
jgi:hypothetical protein